MDDLPDCVRSTARQAEIEGFAYSCEPLVGRLLATLAAAMPQQGRILELGTGAGVGTAWLAHGVGERTDVSFVTVEHSRSTAAIAAANSWPAFVDFRIGDAEQLLPGLGCFDLIFADAEGGKWSGLQLTLDALRPGGVLVVDDMKTGRYKAPAHRAIVEGVAKALHASPQLVTVDIPVASGVTIATRRRDSA